MKNQLKKITPKTLNIKKIGKVNINIYKNKLENNFNLAITKGKFNQKNRYLKGFFKQN